MINKHIHQIICRLAHQWIKTMPSSSMYKLEDLIQEGYIVYLENKLKFDERKSKETTYLWLPVVWRFNYLRKMEWRRQTISYDQNYDQDGKDWDKVSNYIGQRMITDCYNPERQFMLSQALFYLSKVSTEFVLMITDGVSSSLFQKARNHQRTKRFRNGWPAVDGCFRIDKSMLKDFFNIDLKKMGAIYYNNI